MNPIEEASTAEEAPKPQEAAIEIDLSTPEVPMELEEAQETVARLTEEFQKKSEDDTGEFLMSMNEQMEHIQKEYAATLTPEEKQAGDAIAAQIKEKQKILLGVIKEQLTPHAAATEKSIDAELAAEEGLEEIADEDILESADIGSEKAEVLLGEKKISELATTAEAHPYDGVADEKIDKAPKPLDAATTFDAAQETVATDIPGRVETATESSPENAPIAPENETQKDGELRSKAISEYNEGGTIEDALAAYDELTDPVNKSVLLRNLVAETTRRGDLEGALALAARETDPSRQQRDIAMVAIQSGRGGNFEDAVSVLEKVTLEKYKDNAIRQIAPELAKKDPEGAKKLIDQIANKELREQVMNAVAPETPVAE